MNDRRERNVRKLDVLHIRVEELHHPRVGRTLLRILRANAQLVRVARRKEQRQAVIVGQRLNQFEQVDHIDAKYVLRRAVEVLEAIGMQAQVRQHSMGFINVDDLQARRIEL